MLARYYLYTIIEVYSIVFICVPFILLLYLDIALFLYFPCIFYCLALFEMCLTYLCNDNNNNNKSNTTVLLLSTFCLLYNSFYWLICLSCFCTFIFCIISCAFHVFSIALLFLKCAEHICVMISIILLFLNISHILPFMLWIGLIDCCVYNNVLYSYHFYIRLNVCNSCESLTNMCHDLNPHSDCILEFECVVYCVYLFMPLPPQMSHLLEIYNIFSCDSALCFSTYSLSSYFQTPFPPESDTKYTCTYYKSVIPIILVYVYNNSIVLLHQQFAYLTVHSIDWLIVVFTIIICTTCLFFYLIECL